MTTGRTAVEKIVATHTVGWDQKRAPRAGDFVLLRPRHVMTHDNTSAVITKFRSLAGDDAPVADPRQPIFAMDHDIQNHTPENLAKYTAIRSFAERRGIAYFPPGRGIAHQVMVEEGFVEPGGLAVASDSHANMYGALNALGTPVVRTDAAVIWATGVLWWTVPPQVRVVLRGRLPAGVTGKDVALTLCAAFREGEVLNAALEFAGDGIAGLSIDDRLTISNMTTEWGALAGLFPFDEVLRSWLLRRCRALSTSDATVDELWRARESLVTDTDAVFARELELDLSTVRPHVSGPNSIARWVSAKDLERNPVPIDKAYLMSCVNARAADLKAASQRFAGGRRVARGVQFFVAAASSRVEDEARASGAWQTLLDAGAIPLPPGCGACIGLGRGTLEAGEVGISATNRNFDARMGHRDSRCYLASPAVVAESAIRGYIAIPPYGGSLSGGPRTERRDFTPDPAPRTQAEPIRDGFPRSLAGRTLIVPRDDFNTDQIYGKDVTYRDDLSPAEQAQHALRPYDPDFSSLVRKGDILVGGDNFGCGSSREQAATALIGAGVAAVIVASAAQTYQRNAFNNGLIIVECRDLAQRLIAGIALAEPRSRTVIGPQITIDFVASSIRHEGGSYPFRPLNAIAQRLVAHGGLESMVRRGIGLVERVPA